MRRVAWVVVVVLVLAALAVPGFEPAAAQPVTIPTPDFDHDGFGDLAVGAPGETVGGRGAAGAASVLFGGAAGGLGGGGSQFVYQGVGGLGGVAEPTDVFGAALG
jgi:hypothetical protein